MGIGEMSSRDSWEERRAQEAEAKSEKLEEELEAMTKVAVSVMETLEEVQQQDFVLLKNKVVRNWWQAHRTQELQEAKETLVKARTRAAEHKKNLAASEQELADREEGFIQLKEKLKL